MVLTIQSPDKAGSRAVSDRDRAVLRVAYSCRTPPAGFDVCQKRHCNRMGRLMCVKSWHIRSPIAAPDPGDCCSARRRTSCRIWGALAHHRQKVRCALVHVRRQGEGFSNTAGSRGGVCARSPGSRPACRVAVAAMWCDWLWFNARDRSTGPCIGRLLRDPAVTSCPCAPVIAARRWLIVLAVHPPRTGRPRRDAHAPAESPAP